MGLAYAKRLDVPAGHILERICTAFGRGCLGEDRLGQCSERRGGTDTQVYASELFGKGKVIPVVLKFWRSNAGYPADLVLRIHNNYHALRKMHETGIFCHLIVPRFFYSFIEVDGVMLSLPAGKRVAMSSVHDIGEVKNQLVVVGDLSNAGRYRILDNVNEDNLPPDLISLISKDLRLIERHMPVGVLGSGEFFLRSSLLTVESNPPRVAAGDIDKLALISYPGPAPESTSESK